MLNKCLLEEWKEEGGEGEKKGEREGGKKGGREGGRKEGREGGRNEGRKGRKIKVWCQEQSAGTTLIPEVKEARAAVSRQGPKEDSGAWPGTRW